MDVDCFCVRGLPAVEVLGIEEVWPVERRRMSRRICAGAVAVVCTYQHSVRENRWSVAIPHSCMMSGCSRDSLCTEVFR